MGDKAYEIIYETENYQVAEYGRVSEVCVTSLFDKGKPTKGCVFASFFHEDKDTRNDHARKFADMLER